MADLPISGLPAITVPSSSYLLAAVSASVTSQMSLTEVAAAISSSFTASQAVSSSYALTASYWGGGSSYVPYTGATTNVDLGGNTLYADEVIINPAGFGLLAALSRDITGAGFGSLVLKNGATGYLIPTSSLTVDRTYLLPDKNGTVAMLSDISATFPYTGSAQITGSLGVTGSTSISGSSSIIGGFNIRNFTAFGDPASLQFRTYHDDATTDGAWYSWGTEFLQMGPINSGTDATYTMALVPADNSTGYIPVDRPSLLFNADSQIYLNGSKNFRIYSPSTGKTFAVGNMATVLTGSLTVTGSNSTFNGPNTTVSGAFYIASSSLFNENTASAIVSYDTASGQLYHTPYSSALPALFSVGAFYSTGSITTTANESGSFTYTTSLGVNSIHINTVNSHIVVDKSATYNFQFSIQIHNQSSAALIAVWLKKNGVNVPDTATYLDVASNKKSFFALNIWDTANAGDYYEIAYQADQTGVIFETVAATGNIPQSPMIILTVNQVR